MKRKVEKEQKTTAIQLPVELFFNVHKIHNPKEKEKILKIICAFFNSRGGRLIFNKIIDTEMPIPLLELPRKPVQNGIESYLIVVDIKKSENVKFSYNGVDYIWDEEEGEPIEENFSKEPSTEESFSLKRSKAEEKQQRFRRKKSVKECPICHKKQKARRLCRECNWKLRNRVPISKVERPDVIKRFIKETQDPHEEFLRRSQMKCFSCKTRKVKGADCHYCASCYINKAVQPKTRFAECHPNLKHYSLGLCIRCYKNNRKKRNSS